MKRFPLSKTEYGIYVEQVSKENTAYNLPVKIALGSAVDIDRLTEAIRSAVDAHPCLRSAFAVDENGDVYKYLRDCEVAVDIIDADDMDLYSLVKPFDLHRDILFRFYIIRSSSGNTLFFDIHLVDETSVVHLWCDDIYYLGHGSLHIWGCLLITIICSSSASHQHWGHGIQFWHLLLQSVHILIHHIPTASLAESLIWLRGLFGTNDNGILCKAIKVAVQLLLHSLSATHQSYEHKHAPEHTESGEERTRLITSQRVDYFSVTVYIYSHNPSLL